MDWAALRIEMPVTRRWAYMDHAAVAPLPSCAQRALTEWAADQAVNGVVNDGVWRKRLEEVRRLAGRLLEADPQDVAFVKNTSEGVGIIAEGFPWRAGDNVVSSADEYPANVYPWKNLVGRGVELRLVPSRHGRIEVDDLRAALDSRTRLVTLSFVEFATGFRNDLDAVGALCRQRGIALFVDAIQGLGALPLSVAQTPVDFLAADGHKWMLGPDGIQVPSAPAGGRHSSRCRPRPGADRPPLRTRAGDGADGLQQPPTGGALGRRFAAAPRGC
jgi:selenocysteine lyase/cysteine desulfurase